MSVLLVCHMTQIIRSVGTCRHPQRLVVHTPSTSKCLQAFSAKYAQCSGTGGQPTAVSLPVIMVVTRTFSSRKAIGLDRRLLGGPPDLAPAQDLLVQMDTSAVENSFGTVLTSRLRLRAGLLPCPCQCPCLLRCPCPHLLRLQALPRHHRQRCLHQVRHRSQQCHHARAVRRCTQVHVFGQIVSATLFRRSCACQLRAPFGVVALSQPQLQRPLGRLLQGHSADFALQKVLHSVRRLKFARRHARCSL